MGRWWRCCCSGPRISTVWLRSLTAMATPCLWWVYSDRQGLLQSKNSCPSLASLPLFACVPPVSVSLLVYGARGCCWAKKHYSLLPVVSKHPAMTANFHHTDVKVHCPVRMCESTLPCTNVWKYIALYECVKVHCPVRMCESTLPCTNV